MSATHGLAGTYRNSRYGCRCPECRAANTERTRTEKRSRIERLAADPSLAPHGLVSTYRNWGCRCAPCTKANSDACTEWKRARRRRLRGES